MANVKHTTNNGERLTTNCKKVATALKRFAEYLDNYNECYKDMLNNIKSANDNNTTTFTDDRYNTITITLTTNENNDSYTLIIKHTHNAPQTIWSICSQDGTIEDFDDRKKLFEYAYKNNLYGDFETIWIEEKELKDERFDYYETVDYEELDLYKLRTALELDICDMKVNTTDKNTVTIEIGSLDDVEIDLSQETSTDNLTPQQCYIKAYYDGKELTIPCNEYKCKECAIEYIHNLFMERVIPYETLFKIYYGKYVEIITIEIVLDTPDLLQCNIGYVNEGLKRDSYKIVREGLKRLCNLIDDSHKCIVSLVTANNTHDFVIFKSRFEGLWTFYSECKATMQSPESFARWLYYETFTHGIVFKYWHTIKEGDTK